MTPEETARAYLGAFKTGDPTKIADYVSDNFVNEHTAALGSGCVSKETYLQRLPGFLADMVDLDYEIEDLMVDGERIAAFYRMTARWQGKQLIAVRGVQRLVVNDGLIQHRTDYWDSAAFLIQVNSTARLALASFGIET